MALFKRKKKKANEKIIDKSKMPKHIAFICDGNGRWATSKGLPRFEGHRQGMEAVKRVIERCMEHGIGVVSFYCFSTENFSRPKAEVDYLFNLFRKLKDFAKDYKDKGIKVNLMGDMSLFPEDMQEIMSDILDETKDNNKIIVNLGLGYGGRHELVSAVNKLIKAGVDKVSEEDIQKALYTGDLPDPDLIVRASGEQRLSNFMLYQCAYSEFYFPKLHWPDFDKNMVDECIVEFQSRKRRFGKV